MVSPFVLQKSVYTVYASHLVHAKTNQCKLTYFAKVDIGDMHVNRPQCTQFKAPVSSNLHANELCMLQFRKRSVDWTAF